MYIQKFVNMGSEGSVEFAHLSRLIEHSLFDKAIEGLHFKSV